MRWRLATGDERGVCCRRVSHLQTAAVDGGLGQGGRAAGNMHTKSNSLR